VGAVITARDLDAERALLGALMAAPDKAESCGVSPADLSPGPGHDLILSAILTVYERTHSADPVLLLDELRGRDQLSRLGIGGDRGGSYLHTLLTSGSAPLAGHYARLIREATIRRRVWEIGTRLVQRAEEQPDVETLLDQAADMEAALAMLVDEPVDAEAPIPGLSPVREFLAEQSGPHQWVIPGLVERADRVMLVAGEGLGKSVLARQVCALLAAGRHPFRPKEAITPRRTLLIDLENPPALVHRGLRDVVGRAQAEGVDVGERFWRWTAPGGMDLRQAADRALLARAVERARPDLIAIGPAYKAFTGRAGDTHESGPAEFGAAIDHLRARYGCAFWIEHHLPKGDGTARRSEPIGSSYWLRWPEFGLVLRRAPGADPKLYLLDRFRGDRDVRAFPDRLIKGVSRFPWTADYDPDNEQDLLDAIAEDRET
jgi:hypothetical protein